MAVMGGRYKHLGLHECENRRFLLADVETLDKSSTYFLKLKIPLTLTVANQPDFMPLSSLLICF